MWRQTVKFSANKYSSILLLTNERARKLLTMIQSDWIKFSFFLWPARLIILVCYCKKLTDVSFLCVCPVIDDDFCHNIVKIAVGPLGEASIYISEYIYKWVYIKKETIKDQYIFQLCPTEQVLNSCSQGAHRLILIISSGHYNFFGGDQRFGILSKTRSRSSLCLQNWLLPLKDDKVYLQVRYTKRTSLE